MIQPFKKYKALNLACLPVQKTKQPVSGLKTWKGGVTEEAFYEDAYGIGIICGEVSGHLECLDFDNHGGDAKEVISEFINMPEIKPLYDKYKFPIESTMNGGYHLIYRCSEQLTGNTKLASRPKWNEKTKRFEPDAIIETRGEGGYFVCDPTPGYKFQRNSIDKIPVISIPERSIIFEVARSFNTWVDRTVKDEHETKDRPGDIYNTKSEARSDARNCLLSAGWYEVRPGMWRRPDKKDGISATFGKVADGVFYNFSSSAYPFEPDKAYSPFQVVSLLKYNGDFSAFAKELAGKYSDITQSQKPEKKKDEGLNDNELEDVLSKAYIDIRIPVERPPICMYIDDKISPSFYEKQRLFTLGNFSAITGKGKSKKTFLTSLLLAAASTGTIIQDKFTGNLPPNKQSVLLFDTEQSGYDAWIIAKRVRDIAGIDIPNFGAFDLREYGPMRRCEIIEYGISKFKDKVGFVVIDGIADLAKAINDEEEATRVGSFLMKLTKKYNIHIVTVIHQNKQDNYATGHLGSMIIKKAEAVISVERDVTDKSRSKVSCDNMRGVVEFSDFVFDIKDYIPVIDHRYNPNQTSI